MIFAPFVLHNAWIFCSCMMFGLHNNQKSVPIPANENSQQPELVATLHFFLKKRLLYHLFSHMQKNIKMLQVFSHLAVRKIEKKMIGILMHLEQKRKLMASTTRTIQRCMIKTNTFIIIRTKASVIISYC